MVIGGRWSVVGSANLDIRSRKLNQEVIVGIRDEAFGAAMQKMFSRDTLTHIKLIFPNGGREPFGSNFRENFDRSNRG
jgi:phosphatidylserine/phosphatidylglycerophosphate/cardiolipin synthase-like enzyme